MFTMAILTLSTACGYQAGKGGGELVQSHTTLSVPYVKGDRDGLFTAALSRAVAQSGSFEYVVSGGALELLVEVPEPTEDVIGYRYEREAGGAIGERIVPSESRMTLSASASLSWSVGGRPIVGPVDVSSEQNFDFEFDDDRDNSLALSLGQLETRDPARDIAREAIYDKLAQRIVDHMVFNSP